MNPIRLRPAATLLLWLATVTVAQAQGTAAPQDLEHGVVPGDNLYRLATRYLLDPRQWKQLQSFNQVRDPLRLQPGSVVRIPALLLRPQPATAEVLHVAGEAGATVSAQASEQPLMAGQKIPEGTRVRVAEGSFVTLRLADGSTVRLAAGTQAQLRELKHAPGSGNSTSTLQLERGRAEADVVPLPSTNSRFEIRTPLAIGGVRGTRFGVAVADNGDFVNDVREGTVQVVPLSANTPRSGNAGALVGAGNGTRVGAADSVVQVTPLLPAPELSQLPALIEDVSFIDLPLPASPQVTGWQVRIASDEALERVVRNATFARTGARFPGLPDGNYQLAVRALDSRGIPGGEAVRPLRVKARPEAPLLRQPRQGSRLFSPDVELLCTESAGIVGYQLQLARDASFSNLIADTADLAECRHKVTALVPGDYVWRVRSVVRDAQGARDPGPFSKPVAFAVVALPPAPGEARASADDGSNLSVAWGASAGGPWRHQLQIAHDSNFANLLEDRTLDTPQYTRVLPPAGAYYLRVRQLDGEGHAGAWTATQNLLVPPQIVTGDNQPVRNADGRPVRPGAP